MVHQSRNEMSGSRNASCPFLPFQHQAANGLVKCSALLVTPCGRLVLRVQPQHAAACAPPNPCSARMKPF